MNALPEVLRDHPTMLPLVRRQPPLFKLKLDSNFRTASSFAKEKQPLAKTSRTRLKINRYIVDRDWSQTKSTFNNTISYEHVTDSEFYATKGPKDRVESMQTMINDLQKGTDLLDLKVSSLRGTNQQYLAQLKEIDRRATQDITSFQKQFTKEVYKLKHMLTDLRRETGNEITFFKHAANETNLTLIEVCEHITKIEDRRKKLYSELQHA